MGLALTAELNGYPGPSHVLELGDELGLSSEQSTKVQEMFAAMKSETIPIGSRLIEEKSELDRQFANRTINAASLKSATATISKTQGELREAHLKYHLLTEATLESSWSAKYADLRGYSSSAPPAASPPPKLGDTCMKRTCRIGMIALTASLAATASALAHEHGHHASYSAGEPSQPSRTIEIAMSEMDYEPSRIEVKRGEQIRFVLRNVGTEDHEFLLATTKENLRHGAVMKKHPHMQHEEPNGVRVEPKKTAEILWKFTKPGTFEYSCLIPDHREYGMTGHVTVK